MSNVPCIPLATIVQRTIDEIRTGLFEAKRGNYHESQQHLYGSDVLFGLFNIEYNAVNRGWDNDIPYGVIDLIREALVLHESLQNAVIQLGATEQ